MIDGISRWFALMEIHLQTPNGTSHLRQSLRWRNLLLLALRPPELGRTEHFRVGTAKGVGGG